MQYKSVITIFKMLCFIVISFVCITNCSNRITQNKDNNEPLMDYKSYPKFSIDEICGIGDTSSLLDQSLKIWHIGGLYKNINSSKNEYFSDAKLQSLAGASEWNTTFEVKEGMNGKVVGISKFQKGNSYSGSRIFILNIDDNLVAVGCGYLIEPSEKSSEEETNYYNRKSNIDNIKYANGCIFRSFRFNNCFNGAGQTTLDSIIENRACTLDDSGLDTILMAKNIYDNGRNLNESAFLAWPEQDKLVVERYTIDEFQSVLVTAEIIYKVNIFKPELIEMEEPTSQINVSHSMGYVVTLKIGNDYVCDRFRKFDIQFTNDTTNQKVKYWQLIESIAK